MKQRGKRGFISEAALILAFILWTILIQTVDVQPVGVNGTSVGFAAVNTWFHRLTGVHMDLYTITDWLGLVPIAVCIGFGLLGLTQWIRRKSITKVDMDILLLGGYYILVILGYLIFEMIPINYRPILIDGAMEASYPSSTTLLVLSVMPTLLFQVNRRAKNQTIRRMTAVFVILFSAFMVIGRLVAGVHWLTDIVGSVLLSSGLYCLYRTAVTAMDHSCEKKMKMQEIRTKRLLLRPFRESDYDDLFGFLSQLADDEFEGYPGITYENGQEHLKYRLGSEEFYAMELTESGNVIGNIYCGNRDFEAKEIGYIVNKRYQRQGYAAEALSAVIAQAFNDGAHRVYAECDARNVPSWKLLEKVCLRREAHFRQNIWFRRDDNGNPIWKDTLVYTILENDMVR